MRVHREQIIHELFTLKEMNGTKIFSVTQKYKDNPRNRKLDRVGKVRKMTCTFNAKSYDVGGIPAYDPSEKRLFWVYDIEVIKASSHLPKEERPNCHRSIPWDEIIELRTDKEVYTII